MSGLFGSVPGNTPIDPGHTLHRKTDDSGWESKKVPVSGSDVGLGNVDNTSDASKPVSTAQQTALNAKANTSSLATVATSGSYNDLSNKPTIPTVPAYSQSSVTRTLNTVFQPSTTRNVLGVYSITIANVLTITGGAAGTVILEIATNSGFTTGVQELGRIANSNSGTLVVGLTLNDSITAQVKGTIPAGNYARLRTVNTTGTPTFTYVSGQETLLL